MARKITFDIITNAQTAQLKELNKLLKDVKRSADALGKSAGTKSLDKALGLDKVERQVKGLNKTIGSLNTRLDTLDKNTNKIGKSMGALGSDLKENQQTMTKMGNAATKTAKGLGTISKASKAGAKSMEQLDEEFEAAKRAAVGLDGVLGDLENTMRRRLGKSATDGSRDVQTFTTDLRELARTASRMDAQRRAVRDLPEQMAAAQDKLTQATKEAAEAQSRLMRIQQSGAKNVQEVEEAQEAYKRASQSVKNASKDVDKLSDSWDKLTKEVKSAENLMVRINRVMDDDTMRDAIPKEVVNRVATLTDALTSLGMTFKAVGADQRTAFTSLTRNMGGLIGRMNQMKPAVNTLKEVRKEITALSNVRVGFERQDIGNTRATLEATTKAIRAQTNETAKIASERDRLVTATTRWRAAEVASTVALNSGNNALKEKNRLSTMYTSALSGARSVETTLAKNNDRLIAQQRELNALQDKYNSQLDAARAKLSSAASGTARYEQAARQVKELTTSLNQNQAAIDANTANINENKAAWKEATDQVNRVESSQNRLKSSMGAIANEMAQQALQASKLGKSMREVFMSGDGAGFNRNAAFRGMMEIIQQVNRVAIRLAATLGSSLRSAITAAANAARGFVASAGSMFSGLQRALQSASGGFRDFANNVVRSMDRAHASMLEFYAAGYSLLTVGSQIQQMGTQMFRGMGRGLEEYMNYERSLIRAAGASADPANNYEVDTSISDELVFAMQRGDIVPPWMRKQGIEGALPVTFDAQELAQGIYYYSAALGQPVTRENQAQVGEIVQTVMQMAKVTGTEVETAMKGVLNIAMEFGLDARNLSPEGAEIIQKVTAQVGMLANASTMEVSDIIESFKMMGPFLNLLSGGDPGAGLEEAMMAVFAASEVGLRGGNIGRGLSQAFQSLLDPTEKMIKEAGKYFPEIVDEATFNEVFFETVTNENGEQVQRLRGGMTGFFEKLAGVTEDPVEQSRLLAELFTSNATRGMVGVTGQINETIGGMSVDELLARLKGDDPFAWLAATAAATSRSVSGYFDFMKNAWFQFQAAVAGSVSGPLMNTFRLIGEIFFEMAERIRMEGSNIGPIIASIVTAIASLAAVGGTVLIAAGGILLLGRAFAMLGGMVLPFIRMIAMAGATLFALVPAILLVAAVAGLAVAAYKNNFMGIRDAVTSVTTAFANFETMILPTIERVMDAFAELGRAFGQFVNGILLGTGPLGNLQSVLNNVLGPILGPAAMNALLNLRESLNSTREALRAFFDGRAFSTQTIKDAMIAVRMFFEVLLTGQRHIESTRAVSRLGEFLGIEELPRKLSEAAQSVSVFLGQIAGYGRTLMGVWSNLVGQIRDNLVRAFSGTGGVSGIFEGLGRIAGGVIKGIAAAFTLLLGAIESVTDRIADFMEGLRSAGDAGRQILGFTVTFNGLLTALGATIGMVFGARLVLAFGPFMMMAVRLLPILTMLSSLVVGLAGRLLVLAGNILITVAAWAAKLAVMATVAAAQAGFLGIMAAASVAEAAATASSSGWIAVNVVRIAIMSALSAAGIAWAGSLLAILSGEIAVMGVSAALGVVMTFLASTFAILAIAALGLVLIFAGVAVALALVAGASLVMVAATQGIGAAFVAAASLAVGFWKGIQLGLNIIKAISSALLDFASAIGNALGIGNNFAALGYAIGMSLSLAVAATVALAVAMTGLAVAFVLAHAPIILLIAVLVALSLALLDVLNDSISFVDQFESIYMRLPDALQGSIDEMRLSWAGFLDNMVSEAVSAQNVIAKVLNKALPESKELSEWQQDPFTTRTQQSIAALREESSLDFVREANTAGGASGYENVVAYEDAQGNIWVTDIATGRTAREGQYVAGVGSYYQGAPQSNDAGLPIFYERAIPEGRREDYIQQLAADAPAYGGGPQDKRGPVASLITQEQILKRISPLLKAIGVDTKNLSFDDLTSQLTDLVRMPEHADIDWSKIFPRGNDYQKAVAEWDRYNAEIKRLMDAGATQAEATAAVNRTYMEQGLTIPKGAPELIDFLGGVGDAATQSAEEIKAALDEANAAIASFIEGMTLEGSIDLFKNLQGMGDKETVGSQLMKVGDQIIKNAGDVPWLNMTELLMDAAGTGDFNAEAVGQNVHDQLRPALEHTARQLGVSVDSLLADVPKFMAPEGLVNFATGEFLRILDGMPEDVYSKLDTLGIQQGWNEFGLDWGELVTYGTGMAMKGLDWNLADYISESYGISVAEAEAALQAIGINPDVISDDWLQMTERAALTMDGSLQVLTGEMKNYADEIIANTEGFAISLSESELRNMPEAVKLYLDSLGYVFVLDETPAKAAEWSQKMTDTIANMTFEEFNKLPAEIQGYLAAAGISFSEDGTPQHAADWAQRLAASIDTPDEWNKLPAEIQAFLTSIGLQFINDTTPQIIDNWAQDVSDSFDALYTKIRGTPTTGANFPVANLGTPFDPGGGEFFDSDASLRRSMGGYAPVAMTPSEANTHAVLGTMPEVTVTVQTKVEGQDAVDKVVKDIETMTGEAHTIKVDAQTTNLSEASDAMKTMQDVVTEFGGTNKNIVITAQTTNLSEAADALKDIQKAMNNIGQDESFSIVANTTNLSEAADALKDMQKAMSSIGDEKSFSITANTSNLSEAAEALKTMSTAMAGMATEKTFSITANTSNLSEAAASLQTMADAMADIRTEPIILSITANTVNLTEAASALVLMENSIKGIPTNAEITIGVGLTNVIEGADALKTIQDAVAAVAGQTHAFTLTTVVDGPDLAGIATNMTQVADAITVLGTSYTYTITVNAEGLGSATVYIRSLADSMTTLMSGGSFFALDIEVTITGHEAVQPVLDTLRQRLGEIESDWQATVSETGSAGVGTAIQGAIDIARGFAVTWQATVQQSGAAGAQQAINNAKAAADAFAGTYTATLAVSDNASGTINSVINLLNTLDGKTATSTIRTINETVTKRSAEAMGGRIGSAGLEARMTPMNAFAKGGNVNASQYALVGELGPEIVRLPVGSYVHTARETDQMMRESLIRNTFNVENDRQGQGQVTVQPSVQQGDTFIFNGDFHFGSEKVSESFFAEIDRRAGRKTELARRGMSSDRDYRKW